MPPPDQASPAMLSLLGQPGRLCDGLTRREWLRVGGLGALGLSLPRLLAARAARADETRDAYDGQLARPAIDRPAAYGQARACILVYLFGGPSHIDTFDMKPAAPADFRGEFQPIATSLPGLQICEHFPRLARRMDKLALVRSMHHGHPRHGYGLHYMFTGREHPRPDLDAAPSPGDFPSLGAMVARFHPPRADFPPAVTLPRWNRFNDLPNDYAGESAGFLGTSYEPWLVKANDDNTQFAVSGIEPLAEMSLDRIAARRSLWETLDGQVAQLAEAAHADSAAGLAASASDQHGSLFRQAFTLVSSPEARRAFRIEDEPATVRERYGDHPMGRGLLLARRLVEAGAALITVNWHNDGSDVKSPFWDTHIDNFSTLRERLIPPVDIGLSALLDDLETRGLLASTLVVVMGEFGRTPRIGRVVMNAATSATGRDHWPHAYSVLLAGGGVQPGQVYGASDSRAAHVTDSPVTPPDLTATVLHALGIDHRQLIHDLQGRPHHLSDGRVVAGLF